MESEENTPVGRALRDTGYALIGLGLTLEEGVRWHLARSVMRWNRMVTLGEDDDSPIAISLKRGLDEFFRSVNSVVRPPQKNQE